MQIVSTIKRKCPRTPLVLYINGSDGLLKRMKTTGVDVIGLDWTLDMADGRKRLILDIATLFCPLPALHMKLKGLSRVQGPGVTSSILATVCLLVRLKKPLLTSLMLLKASILTRLRIMYLRQISCSLKTTILYQQLMCRAVFVHLVAGLRMMMLHLRFFKLVEETNACE